MTQPIYLEIDLPEIHARAGDYLVRRPHDPHQPAALVRYLDADLFARLDYLLRVVSPPPPRDPRSPRPPLRIL